MVNFDLTYSFIMNSITFCYHINLAIKERLNMRLMNTVIAYLYVFIDANINVKFSNELKISSRNENDTRNMHNIKLQRSLNGL